MNHFLLFTGLLLAFVTSCRQTPANTTAEATHHPTEKTDDISATFRVEILNDKARKIIDPEAEIEVLAGGFTWTEGPLWVADGDYLLFSDIPNNKVYKMTATGDTSTYLYPAGKSGPVTGNNEPGSNGLLLNPAGELVLMQHGDRRVAKMLAPLTAPRAKYTPLGDNYGGKRLNSPNDGAFDAAGNLYFTDPPYGLPDGMDDPGKELSFQGVYFLPPSGEVKLLDSLSYPNGLAFSPDGTKMYVAVSDPKHAVWYRYDVVAPGVVTNKKIFRDLTHLAGQKDQHGLPDGLKVNKRGYVFATGPGGVWIFDPAGTPLARIRTGRPTANCAFGYGEKRLFMTADDYILAVDLK